MSIVKIISNMISPVTKLLDKVTTTDEERLKIKQELSRIESEGYQQMLDFQKTMLKSQAEVIVAEAKGDLWIQKAWRPICMLVFCFMVLIDGFDLNYKVNDRCWFLLELGFGGYVMGRTVEKTAGPLIKMLTKNKK